MASQDSFQFSTIFNLVRARACIRTLIKCLNHCGYSISLNQLMWGQKNDFFLKTNKVSKKLGGNDTLLGNSIVSMTIMNSSC